jgi:hypothetical protein
MRRNLLSLVFIILVSCQSDVDRTYDATIELKMFDEFGDEIIGVNGIKVELGNGLFATTNENGLAEFNNLNDGEYLLKIKNAGFTEINDAVKVNGANYKKELNLIEIPKTTIHDMTISNIDIKDGNGITFDVNCGVGPVDNNLWRRNIKIIIGKGEINSECNNCWIFSIRPPNEKGNVKYEVSFSSYNLTSIGIRKGDKISVRIYPCAAKGIWNGEKREFDLVYGVPSDLVRINY